MLCSSQWRKGGGGLADWIGPSSKLFDFSFGFWWMDAAGGAFFARRVFRGEWLLRLCA